MYFNVELLHPDAKLPKRQDKSIGYDLYSPKEYIVDAHEIQKIPLGFKSDFPLEMGAFIWDRSGLSLNGITCLAGCIEGTYPGEWAVVIANVSKHAYHIKKGDRVGQIVFFDMKFPEVKVVEKLEKKEQRAGGFGSTGK